MERIWVIGVHAGFPFISVGRAESLERNCLPWHDQTLKPMHRAGQACGQWRGGEGAVHVLHLAAMRSVSVPESWAHGPVGFPTQSSRSVCRAPTDELQKELRLSASDSAQAEGRMCRLLSDLG